MKVRVCASGWARRILPVGEKEVEGDGLTALGSALLAGFKEEDIGMITVGSVRVAFDARMADGARLTVLPPIMGG